jgi:hypothetical protein
VKILELFKTRGEILICPSFLFTVCLEVSELSRQRFYDFAFL